MESERGESGGEPRPQASLLSVDEAAVVICWWYWPAAKYYSYPWRKEDEEEELSFRSVSKSHFLPGLLLRECLHHSSVSI